MYPVVLGSQPLAPPAPPVRETIIIQGDIVIRPDAVDGYESARESGSIVHAILGAEYPDVTLRPATARAGSLRLTFADAEASAAAEGYFAKPGVFELVSVYQTTAEMFFAVTGRITRRLEDAGFWAVEFGYQEVQQ